MGKARQLRRERERAAKVAQVEPPSRIEASLIARGMRPEVARVTAAVWASRHARTMQERGR